MKEKIKNFIDLFNEDDRIVYQALVAKKDWLFVPLFLKGNLEITKEGPKAGHYRQLECLYDDVLPFEQIRLGDDCNLTSSKQQIVEDSLSTFSILKLSSERPSGAVPFYAEYDFTKLDDVAYHALVANVYPCFPHKELEIDESKLDNSLIEQMKCAMIGKEKDFVIILDSNTLIDGCFFAPILKRVYVQPFADETLKEELRLLCREKGIIYKEVSYD